MPHSHSPRHGTQTGLSTSADDTRIRWHLLGSGPRRWLLPPGLGTPPSAWTLLARHLGPQWSILTWEMRGCYDSDLPRNPRHLGVPHHADDAEAALRGAGWDDSGLLVLGGWSLGVQISLEVFRRLRDRVAGLVLIGGPFEQTLAGALPIAGGDRVVGPLLRAIVRGRRVLDPLVQAAMRHPATPELLPRLGVLSRPQPHLRAVMADFARLELSVLARLSEAAHSHSARDVLSTIAVPTLIVHGDKDQLTPLRVGRELTARIAGARLHVVADGTHYALLEFPDQVGDVIGSFLGGLALGQQAA